MQNLKRKKWGRHGILCPPRLKKWGGHVPRVPHQIAPMPSVAVGPGNNVPAVLIRPV